MVELVDNIQEHWKKLEVFQRLRIFPWDLFELNWEQSAYTSRDF